MNNFFFYRAAVYIARGNSHGFEVNCSSTNKRLGKQQGLEQANCFGANKSVKRNVQKTARCQRGNVRRVCQNFKHVKHVGGNNCALVALC